MRLLLDTNVLLWTLAGSLRIEAVRDLILSDDTDVFVSAVSWWEIAIKSRLGKLQVDLCELRKTAAESGFLGLPLSGHHAEALINLRHLHNDPFDHMLIAQTISEPMRLITGDRLLADYSSLVTVI
ncbi:MAG: type II toxin-antitoxin system VapC family toxin [Synergistaceae bacterium]|jgi:PIN domain nuclease of toxin-antitoxin system|nr:type II toxin-antitoxin system VapC family toxin [Synergistaceae bacterium]